MEQGEVYFLKMNNGEDLLVQLVGDEEDCLWVTQPYRVELMPSVSTMTVTTSIMRWIPFESLMEEKVRISKELILTYMMVDDIVAEKYMNTIADHIRTEEQARRERSKLARQAQEMLLKSLLGANNSGTLH
jgi:hypothetical protein